MAHFNHLPWGFTAVDIIGMGAEKLASTVTGVVQNWNGKTSHADRRSVSAWGGLEWKGCTTSTGVWEKSINLPFCNDQDNLTIFQ